MPPFENLLQLKDTTVFILFKTCLVIKFITQTIFFLNFLPIFTSNHFFILTSLIITFFLNFLSKSVSSNHFLVLISLIITFCIFKLSFNSFLVINCIPRIYSVFFIFLNLLMKAASIPHHDYNKVKSSCFYTDCKIFKI